MMTLSNQLRNAGLNLDCFRGPFTITTVGPSLRALEFKPFSHHSVDYAINQAQIVFNGRYANRVDIIDADGELVYSIEA